MTKSKDSKQRAFFVTGLKSRTDEATKPTELIQITGHEVLTLNARRAITLLWHNAHAQGIEENKDYTIELSRLGPPSHKGQDHVSEAIILLMQTILTIHHADGSIRRVQFLGGNDMNDPERPGGVLTYSFDRRLIEVLQDSTIWGKISLPVLMALSSKYGISLYENLAQWSGLSHKTSQRVTLDEFRHLIGVEDGKYRTFGSLNNHVIKPNVIEINALAPFNVSILPIKTGRKVTHIRIGWWEKCHDEVKVAWAELQNTRAGRKARISNQVSYVFEPFPSEARLKVLEQKK